MYIDPWQTAHSPMPPGRQPGRSGSGPSGSGAVGGSGEVVAAWPGSDQTPSPDPGSHPSPVSLAMAFLMTPSLIAGKPLRISGPAAGPCSTSQSRTARCTPVWAACPAVIRSLNSQVPELTLYSIGQLRSGPTRFLVQRPDHR